MSTLRVDEGDVLLASGSQDTYIRITRFSRRNTEKLKALQVAQSAAQRDIRLKETTFSFLDNGTMRLVTFVFIVLKID